MSLLVCSGCSTRYAQGLERCPHCGSAERVEEGGGSRLPSLDVACGNDACPAFAVVRRVYLRSLVPGVVEIPNLLRCVRCWMAMPALSGSMEEENMPKVTVHGGASNRHEDVPESPAEPVAQDEEESSPGSSSETSPEKPSTSPESSETDPPKPARTTASRSSRGRAASSTAGSTASSGEGDDA